MNRVLPPPLSMLPKSRDYILLYVLECCVREGNISRLDARFSLDEVLLNNVFLTVAK